MSRSSWIVLIGSSAILAGLTTWRMIRPAAEVDVSAAPVTTGPIDRPIFATGTMQAVSTIDVSSLVSGRIESLGADYNSLVRGGEVLARIDQAPLELQLAGARANYARAEAEVSGLSDALNGSRAELARAETLAASEVITQADLEAARLDAAEAEALLKEGQASADQAKAAVDEVEVNLTHTIIRSPIDGIVLERDVDVGQTINVSFLPPTLFRIVASLSRMQVRVDVDESDIADVAAGDAATFTVDAYPGKVFKGTVSSIRLEQSSITTSPATPGGPAAGANPASAAPTATTGGIPIVAAAGVVEYTTLVDVANPREELRPGMTAVVTLGGEHLAKAVRIPNDALMFRPSPAVLAALGEREPANPGAGKDKAGTHGQTREVWEFDGKRLTPIAVHVGLADSGWTELRDGPIHAGDVLVTRAGLHRG